MEWQTCMMFFDDHLVGWALLVDKHKQLKHKTVEEDNADFPD